VGCGRAESENSIIRKGRRGRGLGGVGIREESGIGAGEKAFEEKRGGYLIDDVFAIKAGGAAGRAGGMAGEVEEGVGVVGSEALVEEVVGEGGVGFTEGVGEGLGLGCLGAGGAVDVEGVADEKGFDLVLADEAGDSFEVSAEGGAVEREEGLGGEAERVGDGETDAAVADVQRESAGVRHGVSVRGKWRLAGTEVEIKRGRD
jgi:hypothetical protein